MNFFSLRRSPQQLTAIVALLSLFGFTLLRTLRQPNNFASAHWLISYFNGTFKRGFIGTLVYPLLSPDAPAEQVEWTISLMSTAVLILFCLGLCGVLWRLMDCSEWNATSILLAGVFVTSPYIVMSGHLNGYFDNLLILSAILSVWAVVRKRPWIAAFIQGLAILIHESNWLVGFPAVFFAALLMLWKEWEDQPDSSARWQTVRRWIFPWIVPSAVMLTITIAQQVFLDRVTTEQALSDRLMSFAFISRTIRVPIAMTTPFSEWFREQSPYFLDRILSGKFTSLILPTLGMLLIYAYLRLRTTGRNPFLTLAMLVLCGSPLLIHCFAHDTMRIWTYPVIVSLLCTWAIVETVEPKLPARLPLFQFACQATIGWNIYASVPLMDELHERFSLDQRLLFAVPGVVLLLLSAYYFKPSESRSAGSGKNGNS